MPCWCAIERSSCAVLSCGVVPVSMKMTTERIFKVMVFWFLLLPLTAEALCRPGHQYWSESLEKCVDCSKCPETGHVVLRPCQVHQDTECGPISALDIDWSFLGSSRSHHTAFEERTRSRKSHHKKWSSEESSSSEETPKKHHKHHYHKKHSFSSETHFGGHKKHHQGHHHNSTRSHHNHEKLQWSSEVIQSFAIPEALNASKSHRELGHQWSSSETSSWSNSTTRKHKLKNFQNVSKSTAQRPESASQVREIANTSVPDFQNLISRSSSISSAPFSATEELIWDWQAVALALAVFACLLFFIVACAYSVHHARQWRRLKHHFIDFEADVGELSTRLSLLLPAIHPDGAGGTVQTDNSNQCVYLEQLLARKRQSEEGNGTGNVYIDRDVPNVHRG
ncbi:uncharacterized protein wgn [Periplaneta americana]|uniref:uncharacterized protein wgn n=1 Tax=Periplaneta americana TaxID=6978 RepID=UPI0037E9727B